MKPFDTYPIEFCGNCRTGSLTKEMNSATCDSYIPAEKRRCASWCAGHYLHYERVVYICSPCNPRATGELGRKRLERNLRNAEWYSRAAVASHATPIAPHLLFTRFMDEFSPGERNLGLELAAEVLKRCDELWVFGDHISEGMQAEIDLAKKRNMPIIKISQARADEIIKFYEEGDKNNG